MGAVRRSHVAALAAVAALLLLLLARLPPPPTTSRPAPHRPPPPPPPQPIVSSTQPPPATTVTNRTTPAPTTTKSKTKTKKVEPRTPNTPKANMPVLTRDIYVAGHETPHPELCPALGAWLKLIILVTSAPSHEVARNAVRLTWGHYAARHDIALGFMLGTPPDNLRQAIAAEDALYGDIIIGRFMDSYSNLTLKTISMLEWVDTYCPRAPRLFKTDDDMFINVPKLLQFMSAPVRANATRSIWGKVLRRSLPKRTPRSKYYVPLLQYPARVFPDFVTGPAYLLTADAVRYLLAAAPSERYVRLEDVFVTGILANKLKIKRTHANEFYNKKVAAHPCAVQRGISIHMVRYHEQFDLWRKLLDGKTKCSP